MIFADDGRGNKVEAARGRKARCPLCREELIARCGEVMIWHWAHKGESDCDSWWEPEGEWHRLWKSRASPDRVEVSFGEHRADILGRDDVVIELQHSSIPLAEIRAREAFYPKMVWVLDGSTFEGNFRVEFLHGATTYRWAHARTVWFYAKRPVFVHGVTIGRWSTGFSVKLDRPVSRWTSLGTSDQLFQLRTKRLRPIFSGEGRLIELERFCAKLIG